MAGRIPKPTHLKLIQGNRGKRALPKNEPKPRIKAPTPPPFLTRIGRNEWRRIAPKLLKLGLLALIDRNTLAAYCNAYDDLTICKRELIKWNEANPEQINQTTSSRGGQKTHPLVVQIATHQKNMVAFGREFGLSPSSRGRLDIVPTEPAERNKFALAARPRD